MVYSNFISLVKSAKQDTLTIEATYRRSERVLHFILLFQSFISKIAMDKILRGLAQLVERAVWDREAGGSSPLSPTLQFG